MTLLIEVSQYEICQINDLIVYVRLEIVDVLSNSIHMNLSRSIVKSQDSTFEFDSKKFIKFILGNEQYVVSKKLLCATNSSYFKNICLARVGEEIDLTNELTKNELHTFKQMLLFILTGSVNDYYNDYCMLRALLITAEKYDVPTLKLTCEHYLLRTIFIENAIELRQLAFSANAKFLKTHSTTFIKFHIKEIMGTETFEDLPEGDKNKIMELVK